MPATPIADAYVTRDQLGVAQALYPLDLYFCRGCAHVQLLDVVDPALMFRSDYTYQTGSSGGIVRHFDEYATALLEAEKPLIDSLVIDIGSNDGTFLRFFKKAGMKVLGIDPATNLARTATASGIETLPRFLSPELAREVRDTRGTARIVTANNVFAHADDLSSMAEGVRTLLASDGVFAFEVSYLVDVVGKMLLGTIFHEHLSYHTVKPIQAFLARHGLDLVDVQRNTIQGGSFVGIVQPAGGPRAPSPRVKEAIQAEEEQGFDRPGIFHSFSRRLEAVKLEASGLLEDLTAKGQTVAGYGAARGGTTLLYRLGIGEHIRFIFDDSPAKQNLFTPGHHIPILPADSLYEQKPEYVFILAWVHSRAIQQNHRRYIDEGGRFIVAYPRVEIVSGREDEQVVR